LNQNTNTDTSSVVVAEFFYGRLNCFEIGGGEGLFVAEKNIQEKSRNGGGGEKGRISGH
jgi:hypothetical protein